MEGQVKSIRTEQALVSKHFGANDDDDGVDELTEKCRKWLEKCIDSDKSSEYSESTFSDSTANSAMDSGLVFQNDEVVMADQIIGNNYKDSNGGSYIIKETPRQKYDNINIYKSKKVHVGDVTYIHGPVIINSNSSYIDKNSPEPYIEPESQVVQVNRMNWLAQPPLGVKEHLEAPAEYVIICHTATEEGFTQADNTLLVRLIQTFHIESRKWKDIAYNFLIGSDGLVYEGRGWGVVGSHTRSYNAKSLGIAFIGCFLHHLPPDSSLQMAKNVIEAGVKRGSVDENYKLLAHCQCSCIESPGKRLFEEVQTWKNWDSSQSARKLSDFDEITENNIP
ncbi:unnamed protein product [Phyllotreta striolata]|uniref:Uncharacterized protein n=1 Tax=Phyllotreta striolata TaxID=444603 RepID=A0A9N9XL70_PHYSR|nr:unnamed protein product [Phyllotreta striolata]